MKYTNVSPPRILWAAPPCLHDTSSGAAIQVKNMFEQLAKRGVGCKVLSALTFDAPHGSSLFTNLEEQVSATDASWFTLDDNKVSYHYLKTKSQNLGLMTRSEENEFFLGYLDILNNFKPDVLFLYGGSTLEMAIIAEAKRRGVSVVMGVYNGNYINHKFIDVDMIFTDSAAAVTAYFNKSKINMLATGIFIPPEKVIAKEREPEYITFINPHPTKGISIVLRLALMAKKKHPHWKFLIVDGRGTLGQALQLYNQNPADFSNVDMAKHTADIKQVYAKTKVLLCPSLWFEVFGRCAAEANMNGIPVIASTSGGLPTTIGKGGKNIEAPKKCHEDFEYFPKEEELTEWLEALEEMMSDDNYKSWSEKALEAGKAHDIQISTDRTLAYLAPLFAKRPSSRMNYFST